MKRENLKAAAFFRAVCARCGKTSEPHSAHWVTLWMTAHEGEHRALDKAANQPLITLDGSGK